MMPWLGGTPRRARHARDLEVGVEAGEEKPENNSGWGGGRCGMWRRRDTNGEKEILRNINFTDMWDPLIIGDELSVICKTISPDNPKGSIGSSHYYNFIGEVTLSR